MDVNFYFHCGTCESCDVVWIFVHKLDLYFYIYFLRMYIV